MVHTYSMATTVGRRTGWVLWDCRLQTYALVLRLFDPGSGGSSAGADRFPPPFWRQGTRRLEHPTVESLVNTVAARGVGPDRALRASVFDLAGVVEEAEGVTEVAGQIDGDGRPRLALIGPDGSVVELWPERADPGFGFGWGPGRPGAFDTARTVVRACLGALAPDEADAAATALVAEVLVSAEARFSLSCPAVAAWHVADEPLASTLGPPGWRSLQRHLGRARAPRTPATPASAAAAAAGAGRARLPNDAQLVEPPVEVATDEVPAVDGSRRRGDQGPVRQFVTEPVEAQHRFEDR